MAQFNEKDLQIFSLYNTYQLLDLIADRLDHEQQQIDTNSTDTGKLKQDRINKIIKELRRITGSNRNLLTAIGSMSASADNLRDFDIETLKKFAKKEFGITSENVRENFGRASEKESWVRAIEWYQRVHKK